MSRAHLAVLAVALLASTTTAQAQRPQFQTTKVDGTDNVYIFRYGNHQSMFVVTRDGVIATDPIGLARPQAVTAYVEEIKKITDKPVKYVIYSHHHYDHIAGGKPFKDQGAVFVAHENVRKRLAPLADPDTVLPDRNVGNGGTVITLGGTRLELHYVGRNHSDSSLVMRLPKEKTIFAVDFLPVGQVPGIAMVDSNPLEWEDSIKKVLAMDWERLISRPSRSRRPARHQGGCAELAGPAAGRLGRDEDSCARRQVLGDGGEGVQADEICKLAGL